MKKIISLFLALICIISTIGTMTVTAVAGGISPASYKKTNMVYIVDGKKYYQAITTSEFNGIAKDSLFYVDADGAIVNNGEILDKLIVIQIFNLLREKQKSVAEGYASAATDYYYVCSEITKNEKMGSLIGKSSGLLLSTLSPGFKFGIGDAVIKIAEETCSPETIKSAVLLSMLRVYTNDTYVYGTEAANLMQNPIIDYDSVVYCANLYAECLANFAATDYLAGDKVREMAKSSTAKELSKYFKNVFLGFADSVIPDIPSVEITKYVTDGIVALTDFAVNSGATAVYNKCFSEQIAYLHKSYESAKIVADKLSGLSDVDSEGTVTPENTFENDYVNIGDYNEDIYGVAMTQEGYIELNAQTGEPLYNDSTSKWYTKYGDHYGDPSGQWCAYFVMWCAAQADIPTNVFPQNIKYGRCTNLMNWFKDTGMWRSSSYIPIKGDVVFFDTDDNGKPNHVGIVVAYDGDRIFVVEGNTPVNGAYQVAVKAHTADILGYAQIGFSYSGLENSFIVEGGKNVGKAYMLPDKSSETVWYVDTDDRCILLCYDSETDFYLLMYPFLDTGKYVTAYVPGDIVSRYMEPYVPIPDASDFYNINKQIYLDEKTTVYHNPSTTALMNGSKDVRVRTEWDVDTQVTVLFEYNNYYFVTTETQSGFVPKEKIDINSTYTPEIPETPETPETPEIPETPETPTPPAEETYLLGDVNMDGTVDKADGTLILEYCAEICILSDQQLILADANSDGLVNVADAGFIFTTLTNTEG